MMILDSKVYGYNKFKVDDTNAIKGTKEVFIAKSGNSFRLNQTNSINYDAPCDIYEIWYNPDGDACNCSGDEYNTGQWYFEDAQSCTSPQNVTNYLLPSGGSSNAMQFPPYYTIPGWGGGGSVGTNPPPYTPIPTTEEEKADYLISELNLDMLQQFYLINTQSAVNTIFNYIHSNNIIERRNTAIWVLNFMSQNQNIPFSTLNNWFFEKPEYTGGEFEVEPDLITYDEVVQQVALPSLNSFETHFPKIGSSSNYTQMNSSDVYALVGGSLYQSHLSNPAQYSNACAVRGSRALLYAGIEIPILRYGTIGQRTQKGGDNKNYILDAVSFDKFMQDKFGSTPYKLEGVDANDPKKVSDLLKGKNGIYVILNNNPSITTGAGYSGHVDLILNGECIGGAYTTPTGGVKSLRIWVLN